MSVTPSIYLIAGEPSGDILGKRLMTALRAATAGDVRFSGVGGPEMTASGLSSLFPMNELSVMGLAEVMPRIPNLLKRIRQTADDILAMKPDVVVTIDAPDFCFRVAKRLAGSGIPIVHYVAPSVWVWRAGRAKKVARLVDHVMCLLPFEPPYFEREGVRATFVGHSILESGAGDGDGPAFRTRHGIPADVPLLVVLPGSRGTEVARLLGIFGDTLTEVRKTVPGLRTVVPTVANVATAVRSGTAHWPETIVVEGDTEKYDAFAAADAALAASGTVSLELAMAGVPSIIAYRMGMVTMVLANLFVKLRFASIVNIVLDKAVMPEFLKGRCRADLLAPAVSELLRSDRARADVAAEITAALKQLRRGDETPSDAAARVVLAEAGWRPQDD